MTIFDNSQKKLLCFCFFCNIPLCEDNAAERLSHHFARSHKGSGGLFLCSSFICSVRFISTPDHVMAPPAPTSWKIESFLAFYGMEEHVVVNSWLIMHPSLCCSGCAGKWCSGFGCSSSDWILWNCSWSDWLTLPVWQLFWNYINQKGRHELIN